MVVGAVVADLFKTRKVKQGLLFIVHFAFVLLVGVMLLYMARHYVFSLAALYYRKGQSHYIFHSLSYRPRVSILIPARNEERVIGRLLNRIADLTYPKSKLDVIVINDASTDTTGAIADSFAQTYEHFKVVHRSSMNGGKGKAAALNDGLRLANGEIVFCFDADYIPQVDIIEKLSAYFVDPEVGAVQGRVTVLNEDSTWVSRLVAIERIGGYRVDQLARDDLGLIPQYGGTVCGCRRELLDLFGGWDPNALTEDTDLTFRVYLAGYKVRYVNEAESYEESVEDWGAYWRQRHRWAKGHMQCFFTHALAVLRSRNLRFREKFDGLLLLGVYFVPILVALSWILGTAIFFFWPTGWFESFWALLPIFLYSTTGNFALFFEVGIGIYLDQRMRVSWLIPLFLLSFIVNTLICIKAFLDLVFSRLLRQHGHYWAKTDHKGACS